ncbi:MAG: DUF1801 domain-containing protein [Marmoricola sp.]
MAEPFPSVEAYLDSLAPEVRTALEQVRATIHDALPDGVDAISYNMPTLTLHGRRVVHYAGWKQHISLYPAPEADDDLGREMAPYVAGKGTLKFPLDQPLPHDLIARIVQRLSVEQQ